MINEKASIIIKDCHRELIDIVPNIWELNTLKLHNSRNPLLDEFLDITQTKLNDLFKEMNTRAKKEEHRFLAQSSRTLLSLIDLIEILTQSLSHEGIFIEIKENYLNHINLCKSFLKTSNGSIIPLPYQDIVIEKYNPIFLIKENSFTSPKYLIFGVSNRKPDIRIKDLLDGKLDIVDSNKFLIYDQPIGDSLTYKDFNNWWSMNKDNKYSWYNSNAELEEREKKILQYYRKNYCADQNPVLIPQVYMHYDPKNKEDREKYKIDSSLIFQRMDFLLLYKGKRIIIEIDGQSHLKNDKNEYDFHKYTRQLQYDRTMKFLGYDIFRISNEELDKDLNKTLSDFFENLMNYLEIKK